MTVGDFLLKTPENDGWSNNVMLVILLFTIIFSLFIVTFAVPQEMKHIIQALFFGVASLTSLVALLFSQRFGLNSPLYLAGFGNVKKSAIGAMIGAITFFVFVAIIFLFDSSNPSPGNVLPIGSAILPDVENLTIFYIGLFAPLIETIFFVGVVFYTLLNIIKSFEFTRRLAYSQPLLTFLLSTLVVASIFTTYHLYVYSLNIDSNFLDVFSERLIRIWVLCIMWIALTQITKSIMAPIVAHTIQNWYAVTDLLKGMGISVSILDLFIWIFIPLVIFYFAVTFVTRLLPKAPRRF